MIDKERLVNCFMMLARVDSESGREGRIAHILKEKLSEMDMEIFIDGAAEKTGTETGNLIAKLKGSASAPTIAFCAHMDTVTPGRGVQPVLENGVIRSAGNTVLGADNKAGIACIIEAVKVLKEKRLPHGDLELIFTVCEESGLAGAKNLDFNLVSAEMGFVLDSDGPPGTIVNRGPSQDKIKAEIQGVAAHAGINPEDGINAIQIAARAIANMKLGRIDSETTANIGLISGGVAINVVPEKVTLEGETRSLVENKRVRQTRAICEALENATRESGAGLKLEVETIYPAMHVPEDSGVVQLACRAARKLGLTTEIRSTGGGSDTHILNSHGIPSVNLGIAMQKVHTTEEFITVEDLVTVSNYVLAIISEAAGEKT